MKMNFVAPTTEETCEFIINRIAELKARDAIRIAAIQQRQEQAFIDHVLRLAPPGLNISGILGDVSTSNVPNERPPTSVGPLFSEVVNRYAKEMAVMGKWNRKKTKAENLAIFEMFKRIVGDIPVASIKTDDVRLFRDTLYKLPPHVNKNPYQTKTIEEICQMPDKEVLSLSSINKYVCRISSLLEWTTTDGVTDRNVAAGVNIRVPQSQRRQRLDLTDFDIQSLISSKEYLQIDGFSHSRPSHFWITLLGIFTAARLEELCQLYLSDIFQRDNIWVCSFNKNQEDGIADKNLKNDKTQRVIPIHPTLIKLGFIHYIEMEKKRAGPSGRVFPELPRNNSSEKYSHGLSQWFGKYRRRYGLETKEQPFHAIRHTVINQLKQKGIEECYVKAYVGHTDDSMTYGHYGKAYSPKILLEKVATKIEYNVDFSHLFSKKLNPYYSE